MRVTYVLKITDGGICQDMERNRPSKCPLTSWRRPREGLVKIRKETDWARPTHFLDTAKGRTYQDTERRKPTKRWARALTDWKMQGEGRVNRYKKCVRVARE